MQLTGIYDLVAVLTHKGRSADSGHYVAWVKQESGQSTNSIHMLVMVLCWTYVIQFGVFFKFWMTCFVDGAGKWIQYDDDNPIPQREEDITRLSGGGNSLF